MTVTTPERFVDADGHVLEHPDGMLAYAPREYRDRIWHVETDAAGADWVCFDGSRDPANVFAYAGSGGLGAEEQARAAAGEIRYAEIRPGAFEPAPAPRRPRRGAHRPDRAVPDEPARDRRAARPRLRGSRSAAPTTTGSATSARLTRPACSASRSSPNRTPTPPRRSSAGPRRSRTWSARSSARTRSSTGSTSTTRSGTRSGPPRPTPAGRSGCTRSSPATCPARCSACGSTRCARARR